MENHERKTRNGKSGSGKTKLTSGAKKVVIEAEEKITKTSVFVLCYTQLTPGMVINHDNAFLFTFSGLKSRNEGKGGVQYRTNTTSK